MEKPKMIFYTPLPLNENAKSGSGIRPFKMLNSFRELGFDVSVVSGYGKERKTIIKSLKSRVNQGEKFDFVYVESSTQPMVLTEKHHLPTYYNLDFDFFKYCRKNLIKVGLFYRDIYWRFPEYGQGLSFLKKKVSLFYYRDELKKLQHCIDVLFVPSLRMTNYFPQEFKFVKSELPPGHDIDSPDKEHDNGGKLKLLYVGGVGDMYQMHELFKTKTTDVQITFSTRKSDWELVKGEYSKSENVNVTSLFGDDLNEEYSKTDIGLLFFKPLEYRLFAMPLKMFEYIGHGVPIIASEGTLTADFIKKHDIGWVIPYDKRDLENLLNQISINRDEFLEKRKNIMRIHQEHTWLSRARKVVKILS